MCLTYAVPIVALVESPVFNFGHPKLVKLVHHDVLGFQYPALSKARGAAAVPVESNFQWWSRHASTGSQYHTRFFNSSVYQHDILIEV